jgi:mono/diheme cytochrome c family protein
VVFLTGLLPLVLGAEPPSAPESLTPAEARGKIIYTMGRSPAGGPLYYRLISVGGNSFPARGTSCVRCHGPDGKGGRGGDAVPPDITYGVLSKAATVFGRERTAYTDALLARAITEGLDSSGEQLSLLMPRWVLSGSELADLLAYLKRLGQE